MTPVDELIEQLETRFSVINDSIQAEPPFTTRCSLTLMVCCGSRPAP